MSLILFSSLLFHSYSFPCELRWRNNRLFQFSQVQTLTTTTNQSKPKTKSTAIIITINWFCAHINNLIRVCPSVDYRQYEWVLENKKYSLGMSCHTNFRYSRIWSTNHMSNEQLALLLSLTWKQEIVSCIPFSKFIESNFKSQEYKISPHIVLFFVRAGVKSGWMSFCASSNYHLEFFTANRSNHIELNSIGFFFDQQKKRPKTGNEWKSFENALCTQLCECVFFSSELKTNVKNVSVFQFITRLICEYNVLRQHYYKTHTLYGSIVLYNRKLIESCLRKVAWIFFSNKTKQFIIIELFSTLLFAWRIVSLVRIWTNHRNYRNYIHIFQWSLENLLG